MCFQRFPRWSGPHRFNDGMLVVNFRMGISSRGAQSMTDNLDASSW